MQTRYSDEKAVRLSVRLSVKRVHSDKTEERSVQIFIPYKRSFSLVFSEEEWLVGATPSTWNFGSTGPRWSEIADFQPIFARSVSDYDYITVVEDRPTVYNVRKILSPSSSLPLLTKTTTHPAARTLCDCWASCLVSVNTDIIVYFSFFI